MRNILVVFKIAFLYFKGYNSKFLNLIRIAFHEMCCVDARGFDVECETSEHVKATSHEKFFNENYEF